DDGLRENREREREGFNKRFRALAEENLTNLPFSQLLSLRKMITGGKSYVSAPPAFSNDAKRLLVCTGYSVSIFSTSTGLQITSLEGHKASVTSVTVVPASSAASKILCFCWTTSLDGTIRYWDFSIPELMKTVDIRLPVYSMVIPSLLGQPLERDAKSGDLFAYVSVENIGVKDGKPVPVRGQILKCNLTKSRLAAGVILAETQQPEYLTISSSGSFFGIRNKRKIHVWKVPIGQSKNLGAKRITLHHTKDLTVLAFHPTQRMVAAGDVTGRILIWRGFGNRTFAVSGEEAGKKSFDSDEDRPGVRGNDDADSCSTRHWHPTEVFALSFSSDGAYLYSGGKEGVLVVWQLDTEKRKYLPRIGSPLLYFTDSPDPLLASVSCADNQIHLLKMPSMEILKSISGIKLPCSFPDVCQGSNNGFAFDQNDGLVALRSENYSIQFYSLFDDCGVCEVVITSVALSLDGSLMTTAEVRIPEGGIGGFICLKFWDSELENKKFSLSTVVYEPHRDAGISALAFHPNRRMVVSTSYGGDFKMWVCNGGLQKVQGEKSSSWMCHSVGSYKKKSMTAAAFSADGSVLAVAAETVITLWDPEQNILVAVIGETLTPIVNLSFAGDSEFLVSVSQGSKPQLSVWIVSKLSLSWSYKLHIEALACAVDKSSFAVLALIPESVQLQFSDSTFQGRDGMILHFNANDPVPLSTWSVRKAQGGGLAFLRSKKSYISSDEKSGHPWLVCINGDHEYTLFDPSGKEAQELSLTKQGNYHALEETGGKFGYEAIYGELPEFESKMDQTLSAPSVPSQRPWETIFSGSSHELPPLTKLCSSFLESLLERRTVTTE
uniref:WD repeat-containing protein 75 second beta-propeller domain-containing protein n=1 Tax=Cucumis melo TaxID=3656 RepID=A0A9I9DF46_CUCME